MKIIQNFLQDEDYNKIKDILNSNNFPWFYSDKIVEPNINKKFNFQFVHIFYKDGLVNSDYFTLLDPILKLIDPYLLIKVKANLLTRTNKFYESSMHIDNETNPKSTKITTGILYFDNTNGYTRFEKGDIVKSEENKYIEFDNKLKHTGSSCTDAKRRIVINFNYIKR